jgi:hypothetical protein
VISSSQQELVANVFKMRPGKGCRLQVGHLLWAQGITARVVPSARGEGGTSR